MRRKFLPFILGGALSVAAIAPVAAAPPTAVTAANGLVNVVVQAVIDQVDVDVLNDALNNSLNDVIEVNIDDSLNNALQNVLQNARILNGLELTVEWSCPTLVDGGFMHPASADDTSVQIRPGRGSRAPNGGAVGCRRLRCSRPRRARPRRRWPTAGGR